METSACGQHDGDHGHSTLKRRAVTKSLRHGHHFDFEHDGHWHAKHGDHWDEHPAPEG